MTPFDGEGGIMRAKRKCLIGMFAVFFLVLFAAVGLTVKRHVTSAEENAGVAVDLTGKSFGADETFAFAAKAEFLTAEAAGLIRQDGERIVFVRRRQNGKPRQAREERRGGRSAEGGTFCRSRKYERGRRGTRKRKNKIALIRFRSGRAFEGV